MRGRPSGPVLLSRDGADRRARNVRRKHSTRSRRPQGFAPTAITCHVGTARDAECPQWVASRRKRAGGNRPSPVNFMTGEATDSRNRTCASAQHSFLKPHPRFHPPESNDSPRSRELTPSLEELKRCCIEGGWATRHAPSQLGSPGKPHILVQAARIAGPVFWGGRPEAHRRLP